MYFTQVHLSKMNPSSPSRGHHCNTYRDNIKPLLQNSTQPDCQGFGNPVGPDYTHMVHLWYRSGQDTRVYNLWISLNSYIYIEEAWKQFWNMWTGTEFFLHFFFFKGGHLPKNMGNLFWTSDYLPSQDYVPWPYRKETHILWPPL